CNTLDVWSVEPATAPGGGIRAADDLPGAGQSGSGTHVVHDALSIFRHLVQHDRPRPNQAHLSLYDIEQLWKLVEAGLPKDSAERCNPRVALQLVVLPPFAGRVGIGRQVMSQGRVGIDDHRAEFE